MKGKKCKVCPITGHTKVQRGSSANTLLLFNMGAK